MDDDPTIDDITEKELLLEIFKEIRAIRKFLFWPLWFFTAVTLAYAVGFLVTSR